jgi:hypothetical protein
MHCYANIGVPKNTGNPYYQQTDKESNPHGYNSLGTKYIDYGLGVALYSPDSERNACEYSILSSYPIRTRTTA